MKKNVLTIGSLALILLFWCSAVQATVCQGEKKTHIFFGNGMFNDQDDAVASLEALQIRMHQAGQILEDEWVFELSYNHDEGLDSLFDVYRQREGERSTAFWRLIGNLETAPAWFQDATSEIVVNYNRDEALIDEDLSRHIQRYRSLLLEGNRAMVVAHSQGNLYANAAYENLAGDGDVPMDAFGIVSAATPSDYVAGAGSYFTRTDDLVINAVRQIYPDTLPGNIVNSPPDPDWKHHGFIDSYLGGDISGVQIVQTALTRAENLAWPTPQMGSGPITVTLTWGPEPDVDLHVFEPNGTHVYYSQMTGLSGYLDVDDVTSYGPEHYYVFSCDTLETGTYQVGLNYYRGSAPENAMVQVQAGDIVRNYTTLLPEARSYEGNDSPVPVARIEVTGDDTEGYSFSIGSNE